MAAKNAPQKVNRTGTSKKFKGIIKAGVPPAAFSSAPRVIMQTLVNMITVMASSGAVLFAMLVARHF
jgi:hypothetical protein